MKAFLPLILTSILTVQQQSFAASSLSNRVVGWGSNLAGEATGIPGPEYYSTGVVMIAGRPLSNVVAVSAGYCQSLAVMFDGRVLGWGDNAWGAATGVKPIQQPSWTNGYVRAGGLILSNVVAVAAGRTHSLALLKNGRVTAWGECGGHDPAAPVGLSNVVAIAAGDNSSLALRSDGMVVSWGEVPEPPANLSNVVAIAMAGSWDAFALRRDGTVFYWSRGEAAGGSNVASNAVAIAAGGENLMLGTHLLALLRDGRVFGWGANDFGEATGTPGSRSGIVTVDGQTLSDVTNIAAGGGFSLALTRHGTTVAWGRMNFGKVDPAPAAASLRGVVGIAAGSDFALAITTNEIPLVFRK